jgi:hypothetical protein
MLSIARLWMSMQPNNDTPHAQSLAGGSLIRKIEKRTKRTLSSGTYSCIVGYFDFFLILNFQLAHISIIRTRVYAATSQPHRLSGGQWLLIIFLEVDAALLCRQMAIA